MSKILFSQRKKINTMPLSHKSSHPHYSSFDAAPLKVCPQTCPDSQQTPQGYLSPPTSVAINLWRPEWKVFPNYCFPPPNVCICVLPQNLHLLHQNCYSVWGIKGFVMNLSVCSWDAPIARSTQYLSNIQLTIFSSQQTTSKGIIEKWPNDEIIKLQI